MALRIAAVAYTHYESDPRVRREAEAFAGRGDHVVVWALKKAGQADVQTEKGVEVRRIDVPRYRGNQATAYIRSYLHFLSRVGLALGREAKTFDVVHVHTMPDFMILVGLLPKIFGAKLVLDMHDLMPDLYALKFAVRKQHPLIRALRLTQQGATMLADAVLCVHQNQRELLERDGVSSEKINIVMNVADPKLFPPRSAEPAPGPEGEIRVVYHGTLLHRYGLDFGLRAFALAYQQEPRLRLAIYGGGDYAEDLQKLARELQLAPDICHLTGQHRPLEEVASLIRNAHIGLVPNRDDHDDSVLPTKLLEYMSVGIPSVSMRTRCVGRHFSNDEVELVPVGDVEAMAAALLRLAHEPLRRQKLVQGGWAWLKQYGWTANRRALFAVFDRLVPSGHEYAVSPPVDHIKV